MNNTTRENTEAETPIEAQIDTGVETGIDEHAMEEAADLEARLATLAGRVVELECELTTARETLVARDAQQELEVAIAAAGAIDPETVRLLVERAAEKTPDVGVGELVSELKDRKPLLFREAGVPGSPMAARATSRSSKDLAMARDAAASGDRASLLRYLRVRREQA